MLTYIIIKWLMAQCYGKKEPVSTAMNIRGQLMQEVCLIIYTVHILQFVGCVCGGRGKDIPSPLAATNSYKIQAVCEHLTSEPKTFSISKHTYITPYTPKQTKTYKTVSFLTPSLWHCLICGF